MKGKNMTNYYVVWTAKSGGQGVSGPHGPSYAQAVATLFRSQGATATVVTK